MYDMKSDFEWFKSNRDSIIENHIGERVVIRDKKVLGYYASDSEAIEKTKPLQIGEYSIQRCLPKNEDMEFYYTGKFGFNG